MTPIRRLAALLACVALVVACGGGDDREGLDASPGPINPELVGALAEGTDPLLVPELQRNFVERCVFGKDDVLPDSPAVQQRGLIEVCGCAYYAVVAKVRGEAAAEAEPGSSVEQISRDAAALFDDLDEEVRLDGAGLPADVASLTAQCIRGAALIVG